MSAKLSQDRLTTFSKLNKNTTETFFVPTESNYFLISPEKNLAGLKSVANSFLENYQIIHFFSDTASLVEVLSSDAKVYLRLVISIFNPGPVIMALKDKMNRSFLAYIPSQPELLDFLKNSSRNWVGILPKTEDNLPFISVHSILEQNHLNSFKIVESTKSVLNIQPAILDCRQEGVISFFQEGVTDSKEVKSALPKRITLETDLQANFLSKAKTKETTTKFKLATQENLAKPYLKLVLGSKENLQKTFNFNSLDYFVYKQKGDSVLFNIGSTSHPATIAKGLYKNLYEVRKFGIPEILILNQNWGKCKWSKIIYQILNEISLDTIPQESPIASGVPAFV